MKFLYAGALSLALAGAAVAGGMNEPVMEPVITPDVIEQDTASSGSQEILIPLTALLLLGVALSN